MTDETEQWVKRTQGEGLSDKQITDQLKSQGYSDKKIANLLKSTEEDTHKKIKGKEILKLNKKLQIYQKIIIGWLIAYLALRLIVGLLFTSAVGSESSGFLVGFWIVYFFAFVLPGTIILIGLLRIKVWAYFLYMVALFFSAIPNNVTTESTSHMILIIIMSLGSLAVLILTAILYRKLFPSLKSFKRYKG